MPLPRVVMISPVLPYDAIPHAGGLYLQRLHRILEPLAELTLITPNNPTNREAMRRPGTPTRILMLGGERARTLTGRALSRVIAKVDRRTHQVDPGAPALPMAIAMLRKGPARTALERADVIDLQWSESIRLARVVRRVNPRARVIGTFHDVQSQLFSREPAGSGGHGKAYWRFTAWRSRRFERRAVALLDEVLVFSAKDAALLGDSRNVRIVFPPLATGTEGTHGVPALPRTALFVAHFARDENDRAAQWLLTEIWPAVAARCPGAQLRLVGSGATPQVVRLVAERDDVTAPGYVVDLAAEYAAAWVCVSPLMQGAGVKFKTIEALLHGVPTVTTTVGAEGIDGPDLFVGVSDGAEQLVDLVCNALNRQRALSERSQAAQAWAKNNYGPYQFAVDVRAAYIPR